MTMHDISARAQAQQDARARAIAHYRSGEALDQARALDDALAAELVTEAAGRLRVDPLLRARAETTARVLEVDDQLTYPTELGRVDPAKLGRMQRGERLLVAAVTLLVLEKLDPGREYAPARPGPAVFHP